eukprot:2789517-Pyramimonas_sp.AAC.1
MFKPFENKRCSGNREHAEARNGELAQAAQHTPKMQPLIVDAVQIAKSLHARGNHPFADRHVANTFV